MKVILCRCKHPKKDCFALNEKEQCNILTNTDFYDKKGTRKNCPFYKTKEQKDAA